MSATTPGEPDWESIAGSLSQAANALQSVLDGIGDGFYAVDRSWRVTVFNRVAEEHFGRDRSEVLGHDLWQVFPQALGSDYEQAMRRVMDTGVRVEREEASYIRPGQIMEVRVFPLPDGLGVSFRDVTARRMAEKALRQSEARLKLAQQAGRIGHYEIDLGSGRLWWSDSQHDVLGIPREMAPETAMDFTRLIHPEDREAAMGTELAAIRNGTPVDTEFRVIGADGRVRWIAARGQVVRQPDGRRCLVGINLDVTARREADERQRLLMGELDHRAKNMLSVIQSLLRLAPARDLPTFQQVMEGRVAALARAHTLLARGCWAGGPVAEVLREGLEGFVEDPARLGIAGPAASLAPAAVQALALAIHELGTNAAKYGALSVPEGRVEVDYWWLGPGTDLSLRWREAGGPGAPPPQDEGFGLTLIRQCLEQQLGGTVRLHWRPDGLAVQVTIPARHLSAEVSSTPPARPAPAGHGGGPAADPSKVRPLQGKRVLVAEDEGLIGLELRATLEAAGADVVGPATNLAVLSRLAATEQVDVALLDVNLQGRASFPAAAILADRGIPFVFCTGYDEAGEDEYPGVRRVRKPWRRGEVERALAEALRP
ncbi:PAS domain-containing protein [Aerophototrophica crusticola]|uniref:histidine kinase n=1 Tax=Aerophototrophica crusticola TaxID=1709002 RepID=A0A858R4W3_9PROT|nr:PAS domain-containing protein [Rhodospirillaceae bacterium B3]